MAYITGGKLRFRTEGAVEEHRERGGEVQNRGRGYGTVQREELRSRTEVAVGVQKKRRSRGQGVYGGQNKGGVKTGTGGLLRVRTDEG